MDNENHKILPPLKFGAIGYTNNEFKGQSSYMQSGVSECTRNRSSSSNTTAVAIHLATNAPDREYRYEQLTNTVVGTGLAHSC